MRRIVFVLTLFLLLVPAGWAQDKRSLEAEALVQEGLAHTQTGNYEQAIPNFRQAIQLWQETGSHAPPGLVLNVALAYDKAPGRHLAAAAWYKAYLALAPEDSRSPQLQERANALIGEFDQDMLRLAGVLEQVYEEKLKTMPAAEQQRYALPNWFLAIQAMRVSLGDEKTALQKIRRSGVPPLQEASLEWALYLAGNSREAAKYHVSGMDISSSKKETVLAYYAERCHGTDKYKMQDDYRVIASDIADSSGVAMDDPAFFQKLVTEGGHIMGEVLGRVNYVSRQRQRLRLLDEACGNAKGTR